MRSLLLRIGGVLLAGLGLVALSRALSTDPNAFPSQDPATPLSPCPGSPNCLRATRTYDLGTEDLLARARAALGEMNPAELHERDFRLDAVFQAFIFKDDVALEIEPQGGGSALHIRSASRVGRSDFGVNERRVRRFFEALEGNL